MIRFIDLTEDYFANGPPFSPVCAFVNTVDDKFITGDTGGQVFSDLDDVKHIPKYAYRCLMLVPEGFFSRDYESLVENWKEQNIPGLGPIMTIEELSKKIGLSVKALKEMI